MTQTQTQTEEVITTQDLEWLKDLLEQAKICQQEANTLQQFAINKISRKYNCGPNDRLDGETGIITRGGTKPELKVETNEKVYTTSDKKA